MIKSLCVWWDGDRVGALRIDEHGDLSFADAADWLTDPRGLAVSISLPKRATPFDRREARPFFALETFTSTTWEDFAREIGMGAPFVRRRAPILAETVLARMEGVANGIATAGFDSPDLHRFADLIRRRARAVLDLALAKGRKSAV